jgi:hypothetical protein
MDCTARDRIRLGAASTKSQKTRRGRRRYEKPASLNGEAARRDGGRSPATTCGVAKGAHAADQRWRDSVRVYLRLESARAAKAELQRLKRT